MNIPVFVEPISGNCYLAKSGEPLPLRAEGATQEEALTKLRDQLNARLSQGGRVVNLNVTTDRHPLADSAGVFSSDDPVVQAWIETMAENRKAADSDAA